MWIRIFVLIIFTAKLATSEHQTISQFDKGLLFKFVSIDLLDGLSHSGQVIGVYNERPFMWEPRNRDTLTLFNCTNPELGLESFTAFPSATINKIFSLNTDEISAIEIILPPDGSISYVEYLRQHDIIINHQTVKDDEVFILEDWTRYHAWEDGRSNYAWDLSAINSELMTYSGQGQNLSEFAVFGLDLYLPLSGIVANVETSHPDNPPELNKALEFNTLDNGSEADLKEKPHNLVEITPGGPFLLRILHMQQNTIPESIKTGQLLENGTYIGKAGNSGTTFCPHVHLAFGFFDQNARYWSLPIEWKEYQRRVLIPFPTGVEFSDFRNETYGYPKLNQLIKSSIGGSRKLFM